MIKAAESLAGEIGIWAACRAFGVPRSTLQRRRKPPTERAPRPTPPRAMSGEEKAEVRDVLDSERFWDCAPREVYAALSAGVTQLRGPKGIFYYLYMIIDVYSRWVTGWLIANRESAELAEQLIAETCAKEGIKPEQLTLHADRGSAMRSKTVAQLLIALGVAKSHSRPRRPRDNRYSEAQFKTMKYRPDYAKECSTMEHARDWAGKFVQWYNHEDHHTGLALMTPAVVHHGQVEQELQRRQQVLDAAYGAHRERFVRGKPTSPKLPDVVWINEPESEHQVIELTGSAASDSEPGAQAGARA